MLRAADNGVLWGTLNGVFGDYKKEVGSRLWQSRNIILLFKIFHYIFKFELPLVKMHGVI